MDTQVEQVVVRLNSQSLDDIPLGIIRISKERRFVYANRAAREAVGPQLVPGASVSDVFLDEDSRRQLDSALAQRFSAERGSDYPLTIVRPDTQTKVHAQVWAVPEYDPEGRLSGSIGFLANLSLDTARRGIHEAIEKSKSWRQLLETVAGQLRHLIAFDAFAVTIVSENRRHLRQFFEAPEAPQTVSPLKWWPMPPFVLKLLAELAPSAASVEELFSQPEFVDLREKDPATRAWLERGFKHILRCPVYRENRLVAIAMLYRREDRPFSPSEIDSFTHLPIVEAINMALALDRKAELRFSLDLIRGLGEVADSIPEVAERLVRRLREHYEWEHVSLFHVDEDRRKLDMIYQSCSGTACLREGYEQEFGEGLLGHVLVTGKAVNAGDIARAPWRDIYIVGMPDTRSELCMPIPGSKLRWILNVESSRTDAFADEEQRSVELLLKQAGLILDRAASIELKTAILHWIADGVIQTNKDGVIQDMNPAAERLFGRTLDDLKGSNLARFIDTGDKAHEGETDPAVSFVAMPKVEPTDLTIVTPDQARVPVLLSGASLPAELGGKVYVATDLTLQRRVERMDLLKQVFRQVASETRMPLALASAFLADATREGTNVSDLVDKARKQIRRADLPLERVVRLASAAEDEPLPLTVLDLRDLAHSLVEQLPKAHASSVRISASEGAVLARGAVHELSFCLQSVLAFLLRQKAQSDFVDIKVGRSFGIAVASLGLVSGDTRAPSGTVVEGQQGQHLREFGLAEPVIEDLMKRMRGRYHVNRRGPIRYRFVLQPGEKSHVAAARS